jgi:hypothetical protein
MNRIKRINTHTILLLLAMVLSPLTHAAYPKKMNVTVELWNDLRADLGVISATWVPVGTDLSDSVVPGNANTGSFALTLNNPMNDSAVFVLKAGERQCTFTLGHEKVFSWFSLNPAPDKFASGRSTGTTPARCKASVIKGLKSMEAYTVRVRMG